MANTIKTNKLIFHIEQIMQIGMFMSFNEIVDNLKNSNIEFTNEELTLALKTMLNKYGSIIKQDNIFGLPSYQLLGERLKKTKYQIAYRNLYDNNPILPKKILLISDTHLDNNIEKYELINNIYNYAANNDINICIHLGDIFNKLKDDYSIEKVEKLYSLFNKYYPKNLKTYAIAGNHDSYMHTITPLTPLLKEPKVDNILDLRILNELNNSFYFYPSEYFSSDICNQKFHFSHRLYINEIIKNLHIEDISQIDTISPWYSNQFRILISGHLHKGFIYTTEYNNIYLGVPSTTNYNTTNTIAYIINIDINKIIVKVLNYYNKQVKILEEHDFCYNNVQILKKTYNKQKYL